MQRPASQQLPLVQAAQHLQLLLLQAKPTALLTSSAAPQALAAQRTAQQRGHICLHAYACLTAALLIYYCLTTALLTAALLTAALLLARISLAPAVMWAARPLAGCDSSVLLAHMFLHACVVTAGFQGHAGCLLWLLTALTHMLSSNL